MPQVKKKTPQAKNPPTKARTSTVKKKKVEDKAWKASVKVDLKGTPDDSRSATPNSGDNDGKPRNSSMTSRDFIRQVLEFDKASESELESGDSDEEPTGSSDTDLKRALKASMTADANNSEDDDIDSEPDIEATPDENTIEIESMVSDSNHSSIAMGAAMEEQLSVYAPMPEFIPDDMANLSLPVSSNDLIIPSQYVIKAVGIYEFLRVYGQIIRLSPFLFEEFLASLGSNETFEYNVLLHEVHSSLIKTLLREEDNNQTSYGPADLKDSMNTVFYFNDALTYPHLIREYLRSDGDKEFKTALLAVSDPDYPKLSLEKKLTVLDTLCNLILTSNSIREELSADGFIKYDDHCRVCQRTGDVLCCDKCSGVYHLYCVSPPLDKLPEGDWVCGVCTNSEVVGVSDCISSAERRSMNRHDPLGYDRHRRKYWFLVRRIIIESEDGSVTYVSTEKQFEDLMKVLRADGDSWEKQLISTLQEHRDEIQRHMRMTKLLTNQRRGNRMAYLNIIDAKIDKQREMDKSEGGAADTAAAEKTTEEKKKTTPEESQGVGTEAMSADEDVNVDSLEDSGGKERAPSTASSETLSAKSDSNLAIPSETELQSKSDITQATGKQTTSDMKITPAPTVVRLTSDGIITLSPPVADKSETDAAVLSLTNDGQPANIDENMEKAPKLDVDKASIQTEKVTEPLAEPLIEEEELEFTEELIGEELIGESEEVQTEDNSNTVEADRITPEGESDEESDDESDSDEDDMEEDEEDDDDEDDDDGLINPDLTGIQMLGDSDDGALMDSDEEDGLNTSDLGQGADSDDSDNDLLGLAADDSGDDDYNMNYDSDEGESSDNMMDYANQVDGADDSDDDTDPVSAAMTAASINLEETAYELATEESVVSTVSSTPITHITVPASQLLQPHVLKSLQTMQSTVKQSGDASSANQSSAQVIRLVSGTGGQGDTIQLGKGPQAKTISLSSATTNNSNLNVVRLSPSKQTRIISSAGGVLSTSSGQNVTVLSADQKLITTSSGQQIVLNSRSGSSQQPTIIGTATGGRPINISKTYGKRLVTLTQPNPQSNNTQLKSSVAKLTTGQTLSATPGGLLVSSANFVTKSTTAQQANVVMSSPAGVVTPKIIQSAARGQNVISGVVNSSGNVIRVVQGSPQSVVSGAKLGQNMVKIISNKTVQSANSAATGQQKNIVITSSSGQQSLTLPDPSPVAAQKLLLPQPTNKPQLFRTADGRLVNIQAVSQAGKQISVRKSGPSTTTSGTYMKIISSPNSTGSPMVISTANPMISPTSTPLLRAGANIVQTNPTFTTIAPNQSNLRPTRAIAPIIRAQRTISSVRPSLTVARAAVPSRPAVPAPPKQTIVLLDKQGGKQTITLNAADVAKLTGGKTSSPQIISLPAVKQLYQNAGANQPVTKNRFIAMNPKVRQQITVPSNVSVSQADGKGYVTRMRTGNLIPKSFDDSVSDIKGGVRMISSFKAKQELLQKQKKLEEKKARVLMRNPDVTSRPVVQRQSIQVARPIPQPKPVVPQEPFKLGMDDGYKGYVNQYTENPHALSKNQIQEEKDKKRHLSYKFSLTPASEFKWHGALYGTPPVIMNTLRVTMQEFEGALPLCFLHPHWITYRTAWLKAISRCTAVQHFAFVLAVLQSNIKPVLFNAVWNDSLGHLSMIRQTAKDKDDLRKREKIEKRQQELLEQNQHLSKITTIKYTKGLKHQIHKLKGEEFRSSDAAGNSGWYWVRAIRKVKSTSQDNVGLRKCARNMRLQHDQSLKKTEENSEKTYGKTTPVSTTKAFGVDLGVCRSITAEVVDVSKGIADHTMYPKCEKPKCKLDNLLTQRKLLEKWNELKLAHGIIKSNETDSNTNPLNKSANSTCSTPSAKDPPITRILQSVLVTPTKQSTTSESNENMDIDVDVTSVNSPTKKVTAKESESVKEQENISGPEGMDTTEPPTTDSVTEEKKTCYSPMCRVLDTSGLSSSLKCYSPFCTSKNAGKETTDNPETKERMTLQAVMSAPANQLFKIVSKTENHVDLMQLCVAQRKQQQTLHPKPTKTMKTEMVHPHKYRISKHSLLASPFILARHEAKPMARRAGRMEVIGWNYNCKNAPGYWPYPCPRPRFRVGWEYRLFNNVTSIHGVASALRVMWACLRWDDMATKPPSGGANIATNDHDITTREILDKKSHGIYNLQTLYKVRTIVIPLDFMEQPTRTDVSEPIREGLRKRKKHQVRQPAQPSTSVDWVPEEQLDLWEITQFAERSGGPKIEKEKPDKLSKKQAKLMAKEQAVAAKSLKSLTKSMSQKEKEEVKAEFEEQLKVQRALAQAKRLGINVPSLETKSEERDEKPHLPTPVVQASKPTIATLLANGSNTETGKLVPQYKMRDKDGREITIRGLRPDQQLVRLANGKITIINKNSAQKIPANVQPITLNVSNTRQIISAQTPQSINTSEADSKNLTPTVIQASLMKAQTLSSSPNVSTTSTSAITLPVNIIKSEAGTRHKTIFDNVSVMDNLPGVSLLVPQSNSAAVTTTTPSQQYTPTTVSAVTSPKHSSASDPAVGEETTSGGDIKLEPSEEEEVKTEPIEEEADDDEGTTLSTEIMQQVVAQALSSTQAPDIQFRLQEMQKKLANVQGSITVTKQTPKSPERLVSEYHEQMKSKPIKSKIFQPKVLTEEELEIIRMKKRKNKEDYKKRKEKDKVKKLGALLEKHSGLLKKEVKIKQDMMKEELKKQLRDEIFAETGMVIPPDPEPEPYNLAMATGVGTSSYWSQPSTPTITPSSTPVFDHTSQSHRASTSKYAKKRKISLSPSQDLQIDVKQPKSAKKSITKPKTLQNKLYCICQTPLDKTKFYVGCDICAQWFHGSCVGISEADKDSVDSFVCGPCKQHQQESSEELYCLCNKPYDDTQFYVGCDGCEGWYHPSCVGITQEEAEASDTYLCPTCDSQETQPATNLLMKERITTKLGAQLGNLTRAMQEHEVAWPFLKPVDRTKVPDYYQVIKTPMDLSSLRANLSKKKYHLISDYVTDATKIFNNARFYNPKDSAIFVCAEKLEKFFVQHLKDIKPNKAS